MIVDFYFTLFCRKNTFCILNKFTTEKITLGSCYPLLVARDVLRGLPGFIFHQGSVLLFVRNIQSVKSSYYADRRLSLFLSVG
jgi:hypothetical protein